VKIESNRHKPITGMVTKGKCKLIVSMNSNGEWTLPDIDRDLDNADDIWIKSKAHLDKVNKYRKRVGQRPVKLSLNNITELVLLGDMSNILL